MTARTHSSLNSDKTATFNVSRQHALVELEAKLKACGDSLRLGILQILASDSFGVLELCQIFSVKQSAMSHHLKVLSQAGLIRSRREGNALFYRRVLPEHEHDGEIVRHLFQRLDAIAPQPHLQEALDRIQQLRSEQSVRFFADNASRFAAQSELISGIEDYREALNELLEKTVVRHSHALEIGPGEGNYLADLSKRFSQVLALDNSASMLAASKQTAERNGLENICFVLGDTGALIAESMSPDSTVQFHDCIVANMVLHHNAKPDQLIQDAARLLAPDGTLVITELCEHEQNWVREAAGDVWLGFAPLKLDAWAKDCGLGKGPSSFTALKNGFRIQIHSYQKSNNVATGKPAN